MDGNYFGRQQIELKDEDALFVNRFEYTEQLLRELYRGMLKWDKKRKVNSIIVYALLGINIAMNIIFIAIGNYSLFRLLIISLILLGVVALFRALEPILLAKQVMKGYAKQYGKNMDVKMSFDEDYLTMYDVSLGETQQRALTYDKIRSVHESENFIVLRMDKRQVMPILKTGFSKGSLEEFRVFIMGKIKEAESAYN